MKMLKEQQDHQKNIKRVKNLRGQSAKLPIKRGFF